MSTVTVSQSVQKRITATLFLSQSLFGAAMIASFTLMAIVAAHLSGSDSAAGVPPMLTMLGRSAAAYPVGWLMDRAGRRPGLSLGYMLAMLGAMLSVASIISGSFMGFCVGSVLFGMGRGASEQARFVAAEVYLPHRQAKVIGLIVFAGAVGAIGGPLLVDPSGRLAAAYGLHAHTGPYLAATVFAALSAVLTFTLLRPDPMAVGRGLVVRRQAREADSPARSLRLIFAGGTVRLAVTAMVIGQLVMTLIMVITPLHMDHHSHSLKAISWVIMSHTLGMYGLSSLTGWLTDRAGRVPIIAMGSIMLAVSSLLTPASADMASLAFALFLLGLGWNFCFIAGSSLLSSALLSNERGRAQGANEMMIALAAGTGSLGTGFVFAWGDIVAVSIVGLVFSLVLIGVTVWFAQMRPGVRSEKCP